MSWNSLVLKRCQQNSPNIQYHDKTNQESRIILFFFVHFSFVLGGDPLLKSKAMLGAMLEGASFCLVTSNEDFKAFLGLSGIFCDGGITHRMEKKKHHSAIEVSFCHKYSLSVYFPPQNIRVSFLEMGELGGGNSTIFYFHP